MAQQTMQMKKNGFVLTGVSNHEGTNYSPIYGYRNLTVKTLEEAIKDVILYVPDIEAHTSQAKRNCFKKNTELTLDESAAIYLYTMPTLLHSNLNSRLRAENRDQLEPWFPFLKLFITALGKLPSLATIVWRGVASDISSNFVNNIEQTWWTVNSCSTNPRVVEFYLGGTDTVFGIEVIHGKDISKYSACPDEKEVVLMPGTRIRVMGQPLEVKDKPYIISLKECGVIPEGKHVMLSYHGNSQDIVSEIDRILQEEHIPVWFNEKRDKTDDIYDSLADGVENAAVVCCFLTSDYEKSASCKLELQYAYKQHKQIIPCLVNDTKVWKPCEWLELITKGVTRIDFHNVSESSIHLKVSELIYRINEQPPAKQHLLSKAINTSSYLFELIKYEYQRNSRIQRFMNSFKSFPIEQSYINLAVVNAKEQQKKEKQLREAQPGDAIMSSFEEIYGTKTTIDVKDIFKTCNNPEKQVLVFGRAGIGKSTFCRYVAYQWAIGWFWSQYELLALIPLRRLTASRYLDVKSYSLIDLVKKEVFQSDLSQKDESLLEKQFDAKKTLWILDGYDEIVQNVPPHLVGLLEQLLQTPHHILTSRPYLITLSYDVQMEITGFTDDNIQKYVQQFFNQMKDELDETAIKSQSLMNFLKSNASIWGVAHIPINLELICSIWSNEDWSKTEQLTITTLYTMITEWLCRRYLRTSDNQILQLSDEEIDQRCQKELAFLESLAFHAMENNTIIIQPSLLKKALEEAKVSAQEYPHILRMGILKSLNKQGTGSQIEMKKDHYFVHLSFQEYFAARYLFKAFKESATEKVTDLIKRQKYNQRFALVFSFASGLFNGSDPELCSNIFWDTILAEPLDVVGIRHMQLVISCLEETSGNLTSPRRTKLLEWIAGCIKFSYSTKSDTIRKHLSQSLQRAQSVGCDPIIINVLITLLQCDDADTKVNVLSIISELQLLNPSTMLINSVITTLKGGSKTVRSVACRTLASMGENVATNEVISQLVDALGDHSEDVRRSACWALESMGEKAATNEVIRQLGSALGDQNESVRMSACEVLEKMVEKAATNEVISQLVSALRDQSVYFRMSACFTLGNMGEKAATNEVTSQLVSILGDQRESVRKYACEALGKMGEKAATNEVIRQLVSALGDKSEDVRMFTCQALGKMGEKAATNEVINQLVSALGDQRESVRMSACEALEKMGEKAATNEVISQLGSALGDQRESVRMSACEALEKMGEKAATNEVISQLVSALGDQRESVRMSACEALEKMGKKAAMNEVISQLVRALGDQWESVRGYACLTLGKMGEKAATNEVISQLGNAVGDQWESVRGYACAALGKMGEKAATNEVISQLGSALGDQSEYVGMYACQALGKMGEKAATNEVISQLVGALGDQSVYVRMSACLTLGKMSEKAATNEVISQLVSVLGDTSESVRMSACEALGEMGGKAATNGVISQLVSALGDPSAYVSVNACAALGKIGERAMTNEVISQLVDALRDQWESVRRYACLALGKMGERAMTNEVISQLVDALGDQSESVRRSACWALESMGEKAATNEVISQLGSALGDQRESVRRYACKALVNMGEKATTNEVISQLVSVLGDTSEKVSRYACEALGKMGEKAATNVVFSQLGSALQDQREYVRKNVCGVLEKMGEKAATNVVISQLSSALGDESEYVRINACEALGRMGEKAATNEVISQLVGALGDENESVRKYACLALGKMVEKAVTNEVISKLLPTLNSGVLDCTVYAVSSILSSSTVLAQLDPRIISNLCQFRSVEETLKNVSLDQLTNIFFTTGNPDWLPFITRLALQKRVAITVMGEKVMVFDRNEPSEVPCPCTVLCQQLIEAFNDQARQLHLSS